MTSDLGRDALGGLGNVGIVLAYVSISVGMGVDETGTYAHALCLDHIFCFRLFAVAEYGQFAVLHAQIGTKGRRTGSINNMCAFDDSIKHMETLLIILHGAEYPAAVPLQACPVLLASCPCRWTPGRSCP